MKRKEEITISNLRGILVKAKAFCDGGCTDFKLAQIEYKKLRSDIGVLEEGDSIINLCDLCFELILIFNAPLSKKVDLLNELVKKINGCKDFGAILTPIEKCLLDNFRKYSKQQKSEGTVEDKNSLKIKKIVMSNSTTFRNSKDYDAALKRVALKYLKETVEVLDVLMSYYTGVDDMSYSTSNIGCKK